MLLVSETHFTRKHHFVINGYKFYQTMHPSGSAHGGSAILIKKNISHYEGIHFCTEQIQATNVFLNDLSGPLQITAVYSPPRHKILKDDYIAFFQTLGNRFIAGGDYNAKHTDWGSRLISPKGRQLLFAINTLHLDVHSTGEPTYWPSDFNKTPDLIDFFVSKSICKTKVKCTSLAELSSDHSPVLLSLDQACNKVLLPCHLHNKKTNWNVFKKQVTESINLQVSLKTEEEIIEAVEHFNQCVQNAAWAATPTNTYNSPHTFPRRIVDMIAEKRSARKTWQRTRYPRDKQFLISYQKI